MDLTSWWSTWQQHRQRIAYGLLGLLLFLTGWQLGRVTSPYAAEHSIVFSDTAAENSNANNGSVEALQALREAGQQPEEGRAAVTSTAAPEVAAAVTAAPAADPAAIPSMNASQKLFVASSNSDLYHHRDCPSVKQIKESNQVWFSSAAEAEAAGYEPSKCTQDKAQ